MAINRQDSRHRIKRTNLTGVVPTAHTASTDFTDGTWLNTDLREAEFFYNIPDKKLWIGTGTSSIEIAQIGSTTSGNSLEQTLSIGNNSGTNNIIMGTATSIKSNNGGGQIDLDYFSSSGEVSITTDGGAQSESYLYMTPTSTDVGGGNGGSITLSGDVSINAPSTNRIYMRGGNTGLNISGRYDVGGSEDIIKFINNSTQSFTTQNSNKPSISISSRSSTIGAGVTNSVILGGVGINATYSNSVYVPDLYIQSGKSIKSLNGGGQIDLDYSTVPNAILISTDNGNYTESFIDLQSTSVNIGVDGGTTNIEIDSTGIVSYGDSFTVVSGNAVAFVIPGTIQLASGTYSTYVQGLQFRKSTITNSSATSSTIATIPMVDGETITIEAKVNAVCTSPNRNYGARLMAVFLKYGGTIYQTSTTDIVAKDGFGDGTTCDIDTDGTNVRIRVTNGGGLTTRWVVTYDYLQSS